MGIFDEYESISLKKYQNYISVRCLHYQKKLAWNSFYWKFSKSRKTCIRTTFWLTFIFVKSLNFVHFGCLKLASFWMRIVRMDHCGMGGKTSITHFLQFSATFGPQEVEPSHDIYICRIVTHILSTLRFLLYVLFQFLVDCTVY